MLSVMTHKLQSASYRGPPASSRKLRKLRKLVLLLFFFQAEDGIRDYKVIGVQTCALPICSRRQEILASRGAGSFFMTFLAGNERPSRPVVRSAEGVLCEGASAAAALVPAASARHETGDGLCMSCLLDWVCFFLSQGQCTAHEIGRAHV